MAYDKPSGVRNGWLAACVGGLALLFLSSSAVLAQSRHIRIGNLWDEYGAAGNEAWGGTCMVWPGGFWKEDLGGEKYSHSSSSYRGFLYGVENFTVPDDDNSWAMPEDKAPGFVYPIYVVQRDIRNTPQANAYQLINGGAVITYRSNPAVVTTDGVANAPAQAADGPEDPNLPADAKVLTWWNNNMGLQTTRTVYGFVHPLHDDYHVWHYSFKNTGKYCCSSKTTALGNPDAKFDQTLHSLYFSHSMWYMDRAEGARATNSCCEWAGDQLTDYQGHNATTYAREDVWSDAKEVVGAAYGMNLGTKKDYGRLRVMYAWDGDSPGWPGEDSGDPDVITGRMMSARWPGMELVHADKSVTDRSDDPDQPRRFDYDGHEDMPRIDVDGMETTYKSMIWPGGQLQQSTVRFQRDAVHLGVPYGVGAPQKFRGNETVFSVGGANWDLPPGDSLNAIWVSAVGGIPYQETVELGKRLRLSDAELAAQGLTRLTEEGRLKKYFSIEDTLFTIMKRAQDVVGTETSDRADLEARLGSQVPSAPPNVATFDVTSGSGEISLAWTAPTSRDNEVAKYRVYRARGSRVGDFPFTKVYEGNDLSYVDKGVSVGIQYFYYVVTVNSAGTESSAHMARTAKGVSPSTTPVAAVSNVYVVPNPYDARYQTGTFASQKGQPLPGFAQQVLFYGLPSLASIHIFTLDGIRIRTIEHSTAAGTEPWDLTSDTGQPVVSGVYIYVVDSAAGKSVGKLIIVR